MKTFTLFLLLAMSVALSSAQWQSFGPVGNAYGLTLQGADIYWSISPNNVYRSTNQGATWTIANSGIASSTVWVLASFSSTLFAGTQTSAAFRSTDNGTSWMNIGMTSVRGFVRHHDTLFACQWAPAAVLRSTNNGVSWTATGSLPGTIGGLWPMASHGSYLFVGGQTGGIVRSINNGATWEIANDGLTNTTVYALTTLGNYVFAGTGGNGVFRSTNNGGTWTAANAGIANQTVYALLAKDSLVIAGTANSGVFVSKDSGATWNAKAGGGILALAADNQYLYAGTFEGAKRRPWTEIVTNVEPATGSTPTSFELFQNYPNPFNPTTNIKFKVPSSNVVSLRVYDLLGREVATLLNEVKAPGTYEVKLDGTGIASGVYLYRLTAGNQSVVRKMILMK